MYNELMLIVLKNAKEKAGQHIAEIDKLCKDVALFTGESDMTADYIWGNCTLEQLESHLENIKADTSLAINHI